MPRMNRSASVRQYETECAGGISRKDLKRIICSEQALLEISFPRNNAFRETWTTLKRPIGDRRGLAKGAQATVIGRDGSKRRKSELLQAVRHFRLQSVSQRVNRIERFLGELESAAAK